MARWLGISVGFLVALIFVVGEPVMAFGKELVLASQFDGRLVRGDGSPAADIRLTRTLNWGWGSETITDETTSAADGSFSFPRVTRRSLTAGILPHTPSTAQEIIAHGPDGDVNIWFADKANYDENGELGHSIAVTCDLDREPSADALFWGTCFEGDPPRE